jgi:hypothetical protein
MLGGGAWINVCHCSVLLSVTSEPVPVYQRQCISVSTAANQLGSEPAPTPLRQPRQSTFPDMTRSTAAHTEPAARRAASYEPREMVVSASS